MSLRSQPIILAAGTLGRGAVLGQISSYPITATGAASNVGTGTIGSLSVGTGVKVGNFTLVATSATAWTIVDPERNSLPNATTGDAYSQGGISFTINAGGTAFAAGDSFVLTVVDAVGTFVLSTAGAQDGSQIPNAILGDDADASAGPVSTFAYISGGFNVAAITFDPSWTPQQLTQLLARFRIFLRTSTGI